MKISIQAYEQEHTTVMPDDATVDECVRVFVNLMASCGYSKDGIAELFKDGDPTTWDSAWRADS